MSVRVLPLVAGLCVVVASFTASAATVESAQNAAFEACLAQAHAAAPVTPSTTDVAEASSGSPIKTTISGCATPTPTVTSTPTA